MWLFVLDNEFIASRVDDIFWWKTKATGSFVKKWSVTDMIVSGVVVYYKQYRTYLELDYGLLGGNKWKIYYIYSPIPSQHHPIY
jgi:hypothetical protein